MNVLWVLVVYTIAVVSLTATILLVSYLLGQRHADPDRDKPYEGGVMSQGTAHVRLSVKYYVIAMFFVVFDVEAAFIYLWAVVAREAGWIGYFEMLIFAAVLAFSLAYLWRVGALDWANVRRRRNISRGA
ncbi:MAG: NADH-quinone oxidoreductase subunit A [Acidobacteria bacterium]|nr:NADH-quinone oxidoreductase subunit A [Acidobacteriota bacterium]